jgi:hypothetical protein
MRVMGPVLMLDPQSGLQHLQSALRPGDAIQISIQGAKSCMYDAQPMMRVAAHPQMHGRREESVQ